MATISELQMDYENLDRKVLIRGEEAIDAQCLLAFQYEYPEQESRIEIDTPEFTAVCPWTGLPDLGTLTIRYVPQNLCIELKSLKYYLLSYMGVGIVHEHVANRILDDLVAVCKQVRMSVELDYNVRGGLHASVTARYGRDS